MMKEFLKAFKIFLTIAICMTLVALCCYIYAAWDRKDFSKKVDDEVHTIEGLYSRQASEADKQKEIRDDLIHTEDDDLLRLLAEHLGEAMALAAIMIIFVEGVTRYLSSREVVENNRALGEKFSAQTDEFSTKLQASTESLNAKLQTSTQELTSEFRDKANQVSENVWNAIFQRLVPEQIAVEIKRILKADVCRIRPSYTVILSNAGYKDVPDGYVIVKRQMFYRLQNITGGEVTTAVKVQTMNTTVGEMIVTAHDQNRVTLPRIVKVTIQGSSIPVVDSQRTSFSKSILLPKMSDASQAWEIYSEVEGPSLLTDRALYVLTAPCDGLEVQVINQMQGQITVQEEDVYLTSGPNQLKPTTPQRWVCEGGLLTGTALSVPWRAISKSVVIDSFSAQATVGNMSNA